MIECTPIKDEEMKEAVLWCRHPSVQFISAPLWHWTSCGWQSQFQRFLSEQVTSRHTRTHKPNDHPHRQFIVGVHVSALWKGRWSTTTNYFKTCSFYLRSPFPGLNKQRGRQNCLAPLPRGKKHKRSRSLVAATDCCSSWASLATHVLCKIPVLR